MQPADSLQGKTALVTGAAARIGAAICEALHAAGAHVVVHYRNSADRAQALVDRLNEGRQDSASLLQGDLCDMQQAPRLVEQVLSERGHLDILINNASSYYKTPIGSATQAQWDDLFGSNARAPFFLSQAAAPALGRRHGCIVNLVDIHAERPNKEHPVYSMAKAANAMMVKSLALELAPHGINVNALAPGPTWVNEGEPPPINAQMPPRSGEPLADTVADRIARLPLGHWGDPMEQGKAAVFLASEMSSFVTGAYLNVDGGWLTL